MDDEQLFALYFAQSCCIQFHPANHAIETDEKAKAVIKRCGDIACLMVDFHRGVFPVKEG